MRFFFSVLFLFTVGCTGYHIDKLSDDDDTPFEDLDGDTTDSPRLVPTFNQNFPESGPELPPEESHRFLVLDKEEELVGGVTVRPIHTLDEDALVINTFYMEGAADIAFDDIGAVAMVLLRGDYPDPDRLVVAGPSGYVDEFPLPVQPATVDFVTPYVVSRSPDGQVGYRNVVTGYQGIWEAGGRQLMGNAIHLRIASGIGLLDQATGCLFRVDPSTSVYNEFLCGLDFTDVHAAGSDLLGNYYFARSGGELSILEAGTLSPISFTLPDTYRVSRIITRDDDSVWVYSSVTSASKGGHHLRRVWSDGSYEEIFYVPTEPWIGFAVIH